MTNDGWRPTETARYGEPVLVRQSDGEAHVARRRSLALGGEIWSRSPYPPVRVTGWRPIEPEQPTFAENTEAGLRMFKVGDRPHVAQRHDGYDLLLDMETRAVVGVQWPIAPLAAKVDAPIGQTEKAR